MDGSCARLQCDWTRSRLNVVVNIVNCEYYFLGLSFQICFLFDWCYKILQLGVEWNRARSENWKQNHQNVKLSLNLGSKLDWTAYSGTVLFQTQVKVLFLSELLIHFSLSWTFSCYLVAKCYFLRDLGQLLISAPNRTFLISLVAGTRLCLEIVSNGNSNGTQ